MPNGNKAIHIEDDDARAGRPAGMVRRVLAIGLLIAIIAMSAAWLIPALATYSSLERQHPLPLQSDKSLP